MARSGIFPASVSVLLVLCLFLCCPLRSSQVSVPAKYDGFVYKDVLPREDSIIIEAFMDPICPDSRDAWPPLKEIFDDYSPHISLIVHPFPLPYHDNSYLACRSLHIANKLNMSTTYPLLELFFKNQGKFYNGPTQHMSRALIIRHMAQLAAAVVGNSSLLAFENGFQDTSTDTAARISFKYGCSRGITGTPFFFVNGFSLPGGGSPVYYDEWKKIIDPLLWKPRQISVDSMF